MSTHLQDGEPDRLLRSQHRLDRYMAICNLTAADPPEASHLLVEALRREHTFASSCEQNIKAITSYLARVKDPATINPLIGILRESPSSAIRAAAAWILGRMRAYTATEALRESLVKGLDSKAPADLLEEELDHVIWTLSRLKPEVDHELLARATKHAAPGVRRSAVQHLAESDPRQLMGRWARLFRDPCEAVRKATAHSYDQVLAFTSLSTLSKDYIPRSAITAWESWKLMAEQKWEALSGKGSAALKPLCFALKQPERQVRAKAGECLLRVLSRLDGASLAKLSKDERIGRAVATRDFEQMTCFGQRAVSFLTPVLNDKSEPRANRLRIVGILAGIGGREALAVLGRCMVYANMFPYTHPLAYDDLWDAQFCRGLAAAFCRLGEPGLELLSAFLKAALEDGDPYPRYSEEIARVLSGQTATPERDLETQARCAIVSRDWQRVADLGYPAKEPLEKALCHPSAEVRYGAAKALEAIGLPEDPEVRYWHAMAKGDVISARRLRAAVWAAAQEREVRRRRPRRPGKPLSCTEFSMVSDDCIVKNARRMGVSCEVAEVCVDVDMGGVSQGALPRVEGALALLALHCESPCLRKYLQLLEDWLPLRPGERFLNYCSMQEQRDELYANCPKRGADGKSMPCDWLELQIAGILLQKNPLPRPLEQRAGALEPTTTHTIQDHWPVQTTEAWAALFNLVRDLPAAAPDHARLDPARWQALQPQLDRLTSAGLEVSPPFHGPAVDHEFGFHVRKPQVTSGCPCSDTNLRGEPPPLVDRRTDPPLDLYTCSGTWVVRPRKSDPDPQDFLPPGDIQCESFPDADESVHVFDQLSDAVTYVLEYYSDPLAPGKERMALLLQQLGRSRSVEFIGVVAERFIGTDSIMPERMFDFSLTAWRYPGRPMQKRTLTVVKYGVSDAEVESLFDLLEPYSVVRLKARVAEENVYGEPHALFLEMPVRDTSDRELNQYALSLQKPVTLIDDTFGTLTLQRGECNHYTAQVLWGGNWVTVWLFARDCEVTCEDAKESLALAHLLWASQTEWDQRIAHLVLEKLPDLRDEAQPEDHERTSPAEWLNRWMRLEHIWVYPWGSFEFQYTFLGRPIKVFGDMTDGPTDVMRCL